MNTILFRDIDGYQVIMGFGELTIDPASTLASIQDKILTLDELTQVNSQKTKITAVQGQAANAYALATAATKAGNTAQAEIYTAKYNEFLAQAELLKSELVELTSAYNSAKDKLYTENPIYFLPGDGESKIDDSAFEKLKTTFDALEDNEKLRLDGSIVVDHRGVTYWEKVDGIWTHETISALGESAPDGATIDSDLSKTQISEISEQVESARIAALTDDEKLYEATAKQAAAKSAAAQSYQEALITGTDASEALSESQTEYKSELKVINAKYGTSLK